MLFLKAILLIVVEALLFGLLLFGSAGTANWPAGWAFLALFFALAAFITYAIAKDDPALLQERMKPLIQKDQPVWDRFIMSAFMVLFFGWLALMPLDAVRFHTSIMPVWLQWLGGAGVAISMGFCYRVFRENTFLAPVVKIQDERGQEVIGTGPYRIVRHPLYASALLLFVSIALMLGSWYGLAATVLLDAGLIARTLLEEQELKKGLKGYAEYTDRVRYRLIPYVW